MNKKHTPPPVKTGKLDKAEAVRSKFAFAKPADEERPPKLVIPAVEGWGKTTLGAHIEKVAFIMVGSEEGYLTLESFGRAPKVDCIKVETWAELNEAVDLLSDPKDKHDAVVIDELSAVEHLDQQKVLNERFDNDWQKFIYYAKGAEQVKQDQVKFVSKLDRLNKLVVILSHCKIETFKNPTNADYDRYIPDVDPKRTWPVWKRWADAVLFGSFVSIVDQVEKAADSKRTKGKGIGGAERVLYCERRDTHDAKNRFGMPDEIEMPDDPAAIWSTVWSYIIGTA